MTEKKRSGYPKRPCKTYGCKNLTWSKYCMDCYKKGKNSSLSYVRNHKDRRIRRKLENHSVEG